jgi:heat shock protein HslJ
MGGAMTRSLAWVGLCALLFAGTPDFAIGAEFPFEHELLLDIEPTPESRRVPSLEVERNGNAELDLWCARVQTQVTVNGQTITIAPGAARAQPCSPDQMRSDQELLAALVQVTSWRREDDVLVLIGPETLRFRLSTH